MRFSSRVRQSVLRLSTFLFCVLVAGGLLVLPASTAAHDFHGGHQAVAVSPDLLEKLGREKVAALASHDSAPSMYEEIRLERAMKGSPKVSGTGTCLVIIWEFTDHAADQAAHPANAYDELLFSTGTHATGSMNDFYLENSYGVFGVQGTVIGWTTASNTYASYADEGEQNASTCQQMLIDAIGELDPYVDYSQFDSDGPDGIPNSGDDDGLVDALFFIHAGPGEESTGDVWDIWSHAWGIGGGLATDDGVSIYRYSVEPEEDPSGNLVTVGVYAHEYGHVLGLPDLYDTDYSTSGIGDWGVMSGGSWGRRSGDLAGSSPSHFTAWSKSQLGWLTPTAVTANMTGVTIPPVETNAVAYRIFRDGDSSGDEYFLLENRRRLGFDESLVRRQIAYGLAAPEGLFITHVDEAQGGNSNERHRLVDVVEATPWIDGGGSWWEHLDSVVDRSDYLHLNMYNRGDNGDLWPGFSGVTVDSTDWLGPRSRDEFSDLTIPPAEDFFCDPTGIVIENIALSGEDVTVDLLVDGLKGRSSAVSTKGTQTWDFETDAQGWFLCNSPEIWDDTQSSGCAGSGGLWFGVNDSSFVCPPGYGNNWWEYTWHPVFVLIESGATITISHKYELEEGYDYGYLELRRAGDPAATWHEIASFNGMQTCVTEAFAVSGTILDECEIVTGVAAMDLRLRMTSDGGWSAQDGSFCGFGWFIDEISLTEVIVNSVDLPPVATAEMLTPLPNPFNPSTTLRLHIPAGAREASLAVYDQRGRAVRHLDVDAGDVGWQEVSWNGRDDTGQRLPSGIYFARFDVDGESRVEKLTMVK